MILDSIVDKPKSLRGAWPLALRMRFAWWLVMCITSCVASSATRSGMYTAGDFGVHALDITGPVTLIDGRNMTLTAHVFVKVRPTRPNVYFMPYTHLYRS